MALVFGFHHVHERSPRDMAQLLGGKGANLAEMASVLELPVPPGFVITTQACREYLAGTWPAALDAEIASHVGSLEALVGKRLGDPADPLLVSVRSGAPWSMPGMMDTVLDLGLNDRSVEGLAAQTGNRWFAVDSYRRFIQLFATVVLGVAGGTLEEGSAGVAGDSDRDEDELARVVERLLAVVRAHTGEEFPQDPAVQLRLAVEAVFRSWLSPRAVVYRRRESLAEDVGTAVNVQAMVFGNRDERSGTGVGFTRDPATGVPVPYGDFLVRAQGEDVVAGTHQTMPLAAMEATFPVAHAELMEIFARLERHYRDMMDVEFTIEQDKLWVLQTRVGKRTGTAALRIAVDMVKDSAIGLSEREAVARVRPEHIEQVLHPQLAATTARIIATGLGASPGAAVGRAYFDADRCADAADRDEAVVLVRQETSPEDVHGMSVAEGILTSRGGLVSHAAVVARGWGKPAVCGVDTIEIGADSFTTADGVVVREGDTISIDGSTGDVYLGALAVEEATLPPEFDVVLGWADVVRAGRVSVRANADTAADAARARSFGAEGIGLCRTEHMFLGDRLPVMRRVILAEGGSQEQAALEELRVVQRDDFVGVLEAMDGLPVTVRLLDPPLHEFLPSLEDLVVADAIGEANTEQDHELLRATRRWHEVNPMLGVRGVRLAMVKDGLYRMQVRALLEATLIRLAAGGDPHIEVMVPLVSVEPELTVARGWIETVVSEVLADAHQDLQVLVGTMIETPRAALRVGDLASAADFFSFGTNDLTQMTFGFSRDDLTSLIELYVEQDVLVADPFETVDVHGVGELVRTGVDRGRAARPDLKIGVCGEHGGDPASIAFFVDAGVDYVSCSPFRVPVARLAVADAILEKDRGAA